MSETQEAPAEVEGPETYEWEVWKVRDGMVMSSGSPRTGDFMERVGAIEHDSAYSVIKYDHADRAVAIIAQLGRGPGDYVLIHDERVERVSIVAETSYRKAEEAS